MKSKTTYFGGKITNPKTNFVVLRATNKVIDTFYIDKDNKFIGKLDSIQEGMYYFVHGNENQYIYLEPKDSIILSLNTWDFDEPLVFSGHGAARNNILVDCFLQYEKDDRLFYNYNSLKPNIFKIKVDAIIDNKLKTYEEYVKNHPEETDNFNEVLKIALTYPVYARIENYPNSYVKRMKLDSFPKVPESFYDFRKNIDINKNELMYYYSYGMYVTSFLYNTTYAKGYKPMQNNFSSNFTIDLLKTIDTEISDKKLKNTFLKQTLINHFYSKSTCEINDNEFKTFFKLSSNNTDKTIVKKLLNDTRFLGINQKIIDFKITDLTNKNHNLKNLLKDQNTLLLFWNPDYISKSYVSSRINFLSKRYSNVQFLTIKIGQSTSKKIKHLNTKRQYFIDEDSKANTFLTSKLTRSILVNKKGIITNGYASITSRNIYAQLEKLSKN